MDNVVDRNKANDLMAKCKAALSEVLAAEGFEITKLSAKFGDSFGFSLSAIPSVKNEFGLNPNSAQVMDFNRYHEMFKLDPNALGVQFTVGRKSYTFEGVQMSRRKFPLCVDDGTKKLLLTEDPRVIDAINAAAKLRMAANSVAPAAEASCAPATDTPNTGKAPRSPRKR